MNIERSLQDLDKHAAEFNFPVLDNAYVKMAAAKMSAFNNAEDWAVAFEVLGYSEQEGLFVNDLYAFGSCLCQEGFLQSDSVLGMNPEQPLIDPSTEVWIADWADWSVIVNGQPVRFCEDREEYLKEGIEVPLDSGPGSLPEEQVLRFFIAKRGANELFRSQAVLKGSLSGCSGLDFFLQTQEWQHPDVAINERPSSNIALGSLIRAIAGENILLFSPGKPNTRWTAWM